MLPSGDQGSIGMSPGAVDWESHCSQSTIAATGLAFARAGGALGGALAKLPGPSQPIGGALGGLLSEIMPSQGLSGLSLGLG